MDPEELQQLDSQASGASWALRRAGSVRMSGSTPRRLTSARSGQDLPAPRRGSLAGGGSNAAALALALAPAGGALQHGGAAAADADGGGSPFASAAAQELSQLLLGGAQEQQQQQQQEGPGAREGQREADAPGAGAGSLSDRDILALAQRRGTLGLGGEGAGGGAGGGGGGGRTPTDDEAFALECVMLAKGLAAQLARGRVPVPELVLALRSGGGSEEVLGRLAPIAGDSAEEQAAQLPLLLELSREELAGLVALHAAPAAGGGGAGARAAGQSFLQWCRASGVEVASA
jgi:hypothetical protein